MDRRTYTFVVASAAFLFFYLSLRTLVVPPQVPEEAQDGVAEVDPQAGDAIGNDKVLDENGDPKTSAGLLATDGAQTDAEGSENGATQSTVAKREWFTLGSMDPAGKQNLLITFCNGGAGIERIELTTRDDKGQLAYRRVDTRSGYLGYFAGETASKMDGVQVNIVGPGTPASLAVAESGEKGIQIGDVILAVGETPVSNPTDLENALSTYKPGDSVTVEVARGQELEATGKPLLFKAELTEHPLDLIRLSKDAGDDRIAGNLSRLSCLMTLAQVGKKTISTGERSLKSIGVPESQMWTANVVRSDDGRESIEFETIIGAKAMEGVGGQPVRLRRTYSISPSSYVVEMDYEVTNLGEATQRLGVRLEGPNGLTSEGWWYSNRISPNWGGAAARDAVYRTTAEGHELVSGVSLLKTARKDAANPNYGIFASDSAPEERDLKYIGVDAQYFAVAYLPPEGESSITDLSRASATIVADEKKVKKHKERAINTSFFVNSSTAEIASNQAISKSFRMYAGPKEPELLAADGIEDFIYYGWFSFFSGILSWFLHFLQGIVGNYAFAIVLLTVLVRGCMFPLSRTAAVNAQRMQELAPEMKKIAEKYKDDMEGRLKAQQTLQKKVGFNPLAGCLPMFMQLPIFMGLYRALSVDIDLRQKPFWSTNGWASNLAAPDQFMFWGDWMPDFIAGRGTGWLGPYLNILPLFVVVLFLTQQKLFMPPATDEQTAMTQKVMSFMTLFMGLFFFRVPAGLCIYFISSSLWGICERLVVKKTLPKGKHFDLSDGDDVIDATATKKSSSDGKQTIAEKLIAKVQQSEPEPPSVRPSKRKRPQGKKR